MAAEGAQRSIEADPLRTALTHGLAFWSVVGATWLVVANALGHQFAFDVHYAFLPASHAVVHGHSPYSAVTSEAVRQGYAYLYPPLAAYLLAPLTLLPALAAETVATILAAACVPATLRVLGVRDWRCYAVAFLWMPIIAGIQSANVTLPMVLGLALIWRYRDRTAVAALVTGLVIALKLFFWPVLLWLVATRRYRTAALSAVASALLVLVPWAGIGFAGLRGYPHLLSTVASREGPDSYSLAALVHFVLPSWTASNAIEILAGVGVLVLALVAGRRGRDRDAFALAILGILALTPLLEIHYFAALVVVVALYRRRLSAAWLLPLLMWGAPEPNNGSGLQRVHVLLVVAATIVFVLSEWRPRLPGRVVRFETARTGY
jgi:alpha-1,2-mannosyltransferase